MASRKDDLDCSLHRDGDAVVVALAGTVDHATIHTVRSALRTAFADAGSNTVVVDLSGVEFLGSAGIRALVDAAGVERDDAVPALRVVVDDTRPVIRPIQLTGLDGVRRSTTRSGTPCAAPTAGAGPAPPHRTRPVERRAHRPACVRRRLMFTRPRVSLTPPAPPPL